MKPEFPILDTDFDRLERTKSQLSGVWYEACQRYGYDDPRTEAAAEPMIRAHEAIMAYRAAHPWRVRFARWSMRVRLQWFVARSRWWHFWHPEETD